MIKTKKNAFTILKWVLTIVFLYYYLKNNNLEVIWGYLKNIETKIWILLFLLVMFAVAINAVKWKLLIPKYSWHHLAVTNIIAGFYSLILPGQLISEVAKIAILDREKKNLELISASVLVDKITGLVAVVLLGTLGIITSMDEINKPLLFLFVFMAMALTLGLCILDLKWANSIISQILSVIEKGPEILKKIGSFLYNLLNAWGQFSGNKITLVLSIALGGATQLCSILSCFILAKSVGIHLGIMEWFWIDAFLTFVLLLPITIGGLGLREGTLVAVLGLYHISSELALVVSFGLMGQHLFRALVGLILVIIRSFLFLK